MTLYDLLPIVTIYRLGALGLNVICKPVASLSNTKWPSDVKILTVTPVETPVITIIPF